MRGAIGRTAGLDMEVMLNRINNSSGRNSITLEKVSVAVVNGSFDYGCSIETIRKDTLLALELAESFGFDAPVSLEVSKRWNALADAKGGASDFTQIFAATEAQHGLSFRVRE